MKIISYELLSSNYMLYMYNLFKLLIVFGIMTLIGNVFSFLRRGGENTEVVISYQTN